VVKASNPVLPRGCGKPAQYQGVAKSTFFSFVIGGLAVKLLSQSGASRKRNLIHIAPHCGLQGRPQGALAGQIRPWAPNIK